jgi:hypothetical protein
MSQFHPPRDKSKASPICQKCNEAPSRYYHKDECWCRTCMDIHDYPHLAHLTQQEREDMRQENLKNTKGRGIFNTENFKTGIGFNK